MGTKRFDDTPTSLRNVWLTFKILVHRFELSFIIHPRHSASQFLQNFDSLTMVILRCYFFALLAFHSHMHNLTS